ncbi:unnamed protein product [Brassicogethes aeneus]|uniref:Uncharacterized protein n=1 Tax=Brassicogethes aeneus TaxID=1431903 RepID=A0A9P0FQ62_BRAAE|nr:unnamed protein product [Brassicogethes aeneus]
MTTLINNGNKDPEVLKDLPNAGIRRGLSLNGNKTTKTNYAKFKERKGSIQRLVSGNMELPKNNFKVKGSSIKPHQQGTGGGPPIKNALSEDDCKVPDIIGSIAVEGHPDITESSTAFDITTLSPVTEKSLLCLKISRI